MRLKKNLHSTLLLSFSLSQSIIITLFTLNNLIMRKLEASLLNEEYAHLINNKFQVAHNEMCPQLNGDRLI